MITRYIVNTPCEIVHMQLGMPQDYRELLTQESHRLKNREGRENAPIFTYLFNEDKENKVIGSDFELWLESDLYNTLLRNILLAIQPLCKPGLEYGITNTWMGIYKENQYSKSHNHNPSHKSFCYYISAKEPYTPMVFDDVGIEIDAITDRLIIFPSHIQHSVPPCRGGERIMIAGNVVSSVDKNLMFTL